MRLFQRGKTWWVDVGAGGGRIRKSLATGDRREAERRAREIERAAWAGTLIREAKPDPGPTLEEAFLRAMGGRWRDGKDQASHRQHQRAFEAKFGRSVRLGELTEAAVGDWMLALRAKREASTVNKLGTHLNVLRAEAGMAPLNLPWFKPAEGRRRGLTDDELARLLLACPPGAFHRLLMFLVGTGCRLSEALRRDRTILHADGGAVTFHDTKGGRSRTVPISDRTAIAWRGGWSFTRAQAWAAWCVVREGAGLGSDVVIHSIRHTVATWWVEKHGIKAAKELLGHARIETTELYTHLTAAHLKACAVDVPHAAPTADTRDWTSVGQVVEAARELGVADGARTHDNRNHNPGSVELDQ